ncbi:MAG: hypothetical protein SFX19_03965 [Alphaproteobacteria bacterium]|nr:hypothetical protein [Alphaproteobacteria bacterium]
MSEEPTNNDSMAADALTPANTSADKKDDAPADAREEEDRAARAREEEAKAAAEELARANAIRLAIAQATNSLYSSPESPPADAPPLQTPKGPGPVIEPPEAGEPISALGSIANAEGQKGPPVPGSPKAPTSTSVASEASNAKMDTGEERKQPVANTKDAQEAAAQLEAQTKTAGAAIITDAATRAREAVAGFFKKPYESTVPSPTREELADIQVDMARKLTAAAERAEGPPAPALPEPLTPALPKFDELNNAELLDEMPKLAARLNSTQAQLENNKNNVRTSPQLQADLDAANAAFEAGMAEVTKRAGVLSENQLPIVQTSQAKTVQSTGFRYALLTNDASVKAHQDTLLTQMTEHEQSQQPVSALAPVEIAANNAMIPDGIPPSSPAPKTPAAEELPPSPLPPLAPKGIATSIKPQPATVTAAQAAGMGFAPAANAAMPPAPAVVVPVVTTPTAAAVPPAEAAPATPAPALITKITDENIDKITRADLERMGLEAPEGMLPSELADKDLIKAARENLVSHLQENISEQLLQKERLNSELKDLTENNASISKEEAARVAAIREEIKAIDGKADAVKEVSGIKLEARKVNDVDAISYELKTHGKLTGALEAKLTSIKETDMDERLAVLSEQDRTKLKEVINKAITDEKGKTDAEGAPSVNQTRLLELQKLQTKVGAGSNTSDSTQARDLAKALKAMSDQELQEYMDSRSAKEVGEIAQALQNEVDAANGDREKGGLYQRQLDRMRAINPALQVSNAKKASDSINTNVTGENDDGLENAKIIDATELGEAITGFNTELAKLDGTSGISSADLQLLLAEGTRKNGRFQLSEKAVDDLKEMIPQMQKREAEAAAAAAKSEAAQADRTEDMRMQRAMDQWVGRGSRGNEDLKNALNALRADMVDGRVGAHRDLNQDGEFDYEDLRKFLDEFAKRNNSAEAYQGYNLAGIQRIMDNTQPVVEAPSTPNERGTGNSGPARPR